MVRSEVIERDETDNGRFFRIMKNKERKCIGKNESDLAFSLNSILQVDFPLNTVMTVEDGDSVWLSASYNWRGKLTAADVIVDDNSEFIARMLRLRDGEWSTDENGMFSWENGDVPRGSAISILGFYRK